MWIFIEMCVLPLGCSKYLFMNENWYIHEAWHLLQLDIYSLFSLNSSQEIMEKTAFPFLFMCLCRWIVPNKYITASSHSFAALAIVASIKNVMNGKFSSYILYFCLNNSCTQYHFQQLFFVQYWIPFSGKAELQWGSGVHQWVSGHKK